MDLDTGMTDACVVENNSNLNFNRDPGPTLDPASPSSNFKMKVDGSFTVHCITLPIGCGVLVTYQQALQTIEAIDRP